MSRSPAFLLAACALAALLALPAGAQSPGGSSLTLTLPSQVEAANSTTKAVPVTVDLAVNAGACLGGGSVTVNLQATRSGAGNASVTLQPNVLTFNIGQVDTATSGKTYKGTSTLVVDAGTVQRETPVNVTVAGTVVSGCTASGVPGAGSQPQTAATTVVFRPLAGTTGEPEEVVPGFGLPLLVVALLGALLALRRKA